MSRANRPPARDELHGGFPYQPLDDAALAIGKSIMDEVFCPTASGKIPPENWTCRALRDKHSREPFREWAARVERYYDIQDDYHGGW